MITKEQWSRIQAVLRDFSAVHFTFEGRKIMVKLSRIAECELAYVVTVDGQMVTAWLEGMAGFDPLSKVLFRKVISAKHTKLINKLKKERGGRAFLRAKDNAWLNEKSVKYVPWFTSAKAVVSHYSKVEGLELDEDCVRGGALCELI